MKFKSRKAKWGIITGSILLVIAGTITFIGLNYLPNMGLSTSFLIIPVMVGLLVGGVEFIANSVDLEVKVRG